MPKAQLQTLHCNFLRRVYTLLTIFYGTAVEDKYLLNSWNELSLVMRRNGDKIPVNYRKFQLFLNKTLTRCLSFTFRQNQVLWPISSMITKI
jgi:hypothetical protein